MQRSASANEQRKPFSRGSPASFGQSNQIDTNAQEGAQQSFPQAPAPETGVSQHAPAAKTGVPLANISNRPGVHIDVQQASARFLDQVEATRAQYKKDVQQLMVDNEQLQAERKELQMAKDNAAQEALRAKQTVDQAKAELADTQAQLSKAKLDLEDVQGYDTQAIRACKDSSDSLYLSLTSCLCYLNLVHALSIRLVTM